ncbi:MAG TPA: hypothetical protein VNG52_06265 [Stellaceae bacterium]|nr:hypothetical protein [Stellaceae bacterium]
MWQSSEVRFAPDHPTAAGHFPSNPIIPGALLLDEVVRAVAGDPTGDGEVVIRAAKFFRPVRPGETVVVRWQPQAAGEIKFECRVLSDEGLAAVGTIGLGRMAR